jgi:DNA-binding transcriptional regulator YhcF (GntR family)
MDKKYHQIAQLIENRINRGNYPEGSLPSLRNLGVELGANYLTVRQALHYLCDKGILISSNKKKFEIVSNNTFSSNLKIATLMPIDATGSLFSNLVKFTHQNKKISIKRFFYSYYEDEIIPTVIDGDFDIVFFLIDPLKISQLFIEKIQKNKNKVISLTFDYTNLEIRLLAESDIESSINKLLEVIAKRGHRRLDILAAVHDNEILNKRIHTCEKNAERYGLTHTCIQHIVPEFLHEFEFARKITSDIYSKGMAPDAIFVPTVPAAMAVQRSLNDLGYKPGIDCSLVSCEDLEFAQNCLPSITVSYTQDIFPFIKKLIEKHLKGEYDQLVFQPKIPNIFIGESLKRI